MLPRLLLLVLVLILPAPSALATGLDLGLASGFAVLGFDPSDPTRDLGVSVSSSDVFGDIGVAATGLSVFKKGVLAGNLLVAGASASVIHDDYLVDGTNVVVSAQQGAAIDALLAQATADAMAASLAFTSLAATEVLGDLNGDFARSGGGMNVFSVDDLELNGNTMTLSGGAGDTFLFNVAGDFDFAKSRIVLDGISAGQVLFNLSGDGPDASIFKSESVFHGTLLAPERRVEFLNGQMFGALLGREVRVHSHATLTHVPVVPEPSTGLLLASGVAGLALWRRRSAA